MSNNKQTAVEWLYIKIKQHCDVDAVPNNILEQAKEIEKQQIINAHLTGLIRPLEIEATKQAEQYYNEEYGEQ